MQYIVFFVSSPLIIAILINIISGETSSSFVVSDAGTYSFYADGTYLNPTFMVTIEEPIFVPAPICASPAEFFVITYPLSSAKKYLEMVHI